MIEALLITRGAQRMLETDPHGWTLAIISVCTVFCCLLVLFGIYTLIGAIFTGKFRRKDRAAASETAVPSRTIFTRARVDRPEGGRFCQEGIAASGAAPTAEVAAAIAMALEAESGTEEAAAIAMALHLYTSECTHDAEPGIITIKRSGSGAWADKALTFRKQPARN